MQMLAQFEAYEMRNQRKLQEKLVRDFCSADVKTKDTHTEVTFQRKKVDRVNSFLKSVGGDLKLSPNIVVEEDESVLEMTGDQIAKRLCGNKDCPAVKKFKEYGSETLTDRSGEAKRILICRNRALGYRQGSGDGLWGRRTACHVRNQPHVWHNARVRALRGIFEAQTGWTSVYRSQ